MAKLTAFLFTSLDGYYKDSTDGISWHHHSEEGSRFSEESLQDNNILLFGRKTHDLMYSFWPTRMAMESFPDVAKGMNSSRKLVVSRTLEKSPWENTTVMGQDWLEELAEMKKSNDITLLGSGTILTQLADAELLDELQLMIDPLAIGEGKPVFSGLKEILHMTLTDTKIFKTGTLVLSYKVKH